MAEKRGIVEIIMALTVGVEYFTPYPSPKKYKNGSKRAVSKNNL